LFSKQQIQQLVLFSLQETHCAESVGQHFSPSFRYPDASTGMPEKHASTPAAVGFPGSRQRRIATDFLCVVIKKDLNSANLAIRSM